MLSEEASLSNFMSGYSISVSLLFLQWLFYSIAMIIKLIKHRRNIAKQYSYTDKISLNWLFAFVILYLTYFLIEIAIYLFPGLNVTEPMYFSIVSLHIFIVGIWGLRQKDIYTLREKQILPIESVLSNKTKPKDIESTDPDILPASQEETKTSTELEKEKKQALLSESQKLELSQKITEIMERERLYLNPELSLDDLSAALMIHKNYVSYVINDVFKMNFYNYINRYRIEEAKRMLLDHGYDNLSIEGIAKSCGYKSRNVFYPVFKKMEGITPMEYKKKY
jgi:AraC-like DNA-binding protein